MLSMWPTRVPTPWAQTLALQLEQFAPTLEAPKQGMYWSGGASVVGTLRSAMDARGSAVRHPRSGASTAACQASLLQGA